MSLHPDDFELARLDSSALDRAIRRRVPPPRRGDQLLRMVVAGLFATLLIGVLPLARGWGQTDEGPQPVQGEEVGGGPREAEPVPLPSDLNLFNLLVSGGWFMIPLLALSVLVVTMSVERGLAVRRPHVLPPNLVRELGELGQAGGGFDPRAAYRACQLFPSAAARVIQAMLTKVGRPQSEVEHTVSEASQREADRLHANVRWLTLAAQVAPLLGLMGTVWGMIQAFYDTTKLGPGENKSEALAEGIYTALVTTLVGLIIAIPAAIAAHYFESRIVWLFHQIDELAFSLFPQVERFEGKVRFSRQED